MKSYYEERYEAYDRGHEALKALKEARTYFEKARTWGFIDIFANGMISTMVKRNHMRNGQMCLQKAIRLLNVYQRELDDIHMSFDSNGFENFADYFFDNPIVDLMVQSKIQNTLQMINDTIDRLEYQLDSLNY